MTVNNAINSQPQTYSPVVSDSSGNNFTMSAQNGDYIKIGNYYFINIDVAWTSKGSASATDAVRISLPITIGSRPDRPCFAVAGVSGITATALYAGGTNGNNYLNIYNFTGSGTGNILVSGFSASGFLQLAGWVSI